MKRSLILILLLLVVLVLMMNRTGVWRAPGATTKSEQRSIKGMSLMADDF